MNLDIHRLNIPPEKKSLFNTVRSEYYRASDWLHWKLPFPRARYKIHAAWYYAKCFVWNKYNRLKIRTLPPTWVDRDTRMAHAMFQLLSDYVEEEADGICWDDRKEVRQKMDELLHWWREVYLKFDEFYEFKEEDVEPWTGSMENCPKRAKAYDRINELEDQMNNELEVRLRELLDIRKYLWS